MNTVLVIVGIITAILFILIAASGPDQLRKSNDIPFFFGTLVALALLSSGGFYFGLG